jgi:hypothetical protein
MSATSTIGARSNQPRHPPLSSCTTQTSKLEPCDPAEQLVVLQERKCRGGVSIEVGECRQNSELRKL